MNKLFNCRCRDCKKEDDINFMIKDSVWLSVAKDSDILCLDCFQKRIKRELTPQDFDWGLPCNILEDKIRIICGFKPLTKEEKEQLENFLSKKR